MLKSKAILEMEFLREKYQTKYYDQAWSIVQNWIFSLIVDQEKCFRFALLKCDKQKQLIQQQKVSYIESMIVKVLDSLKETKNMQFVKLNYINKAKGVKSDLQEVILKNLTLRSQAYQFESVAILRNKPHLKTKQDSTYKISLESSRLPPLQMLFKNATDIIETTSSQFHITPQQFELNAKSLNEKDFHQIVTNQTLNLFADPEITFKNHRVFVCAKDVLSAQETENSKFSKLLADAQTFDNLIDRQQQMIGGTIAQSQVFSIMNFNQQVKKIKNSNQLKVSLDNNSYSVLCESQLIHLMKSEMFCKYFNTQELQEETKTGSHLKSFYVLEGDSQYSVPPSVYPAEQDDALVEAFNSKDPLIQKDNKSPRYIRRLRDFEILMLLLTYLKVTNQVQLVEAKISAESLKKLKSQTTSLQWQQYYLVDKLTPSNQIIKQYLVKVTKQDSTLQLPEAETSHQQLCQWPNCLQVQEDLLINSNNSVSSTPQANNSSTQARKRPESGSGRRPQKKVSRLPIQLELELKDSSYMRFMKKCKIIKDKSSKNFQSNNQSMSEQRQSFSKKEAGLKVCQYHKELEQYVIQRYQVTLQPLGLVCNNMYKGLKNFEDWKEELKTSLSCDLFVGSNKTTMKDIFHKIFNFSINQSRTGVPHISILVDTLQQQPVHINYLENFYAWISRFTASIRPSQSKNPQFVDATNHFMNQVVAFIGNMKQAQDNEAYIVKEIKAWIGNAELPKGYLKEIYQQVVDIVQNKDVIAKFQMFQQIIDRVNIAKQQMQHVKGQAPYQGNYSQDVNMLPRISELQNNSLRLMQQQQSANMQYQRQDSITSQKQAIQQQVATMDKLTSIYGSSQRRPQAPTKLFDTSNQRPPTSSDQQSAKLQSLSRKQSLGSRKELPVQDNFTTNLEHQYNIGITDFKRSQTTYNSHQQQQPLKSGPTTYFSSIEQYQGQQSSNNSPMTKSVYKAQGINPFNMAPTTALPKQRASSAYKPRQDPPVPQVQNPQAYQTAYSVTRPPTQDSLTNQQSQRKFQDNSAASLIASVYQQPPPRFPAQSSITTQQQIQQIYSNPSAKKGVSQNRRNTNHNIDRQQTIVMTYSNAVPRVGSAHKEKKKMTKTFYDKTR